MPSPWDLIAEREAAATAAAEHRVRHHHGSKARQGHMPGACLGTAAKDTETMRAKLKRLVARQILIEAEPGLFSLARATPPA